VRALAAVILLALGCGPPDPVHAITPTAPPHASASAPAPLGKRVVSVIGTNDLHGRVLALPLLGGYLANLRRARTADGGAVLLLDGGDMFQGTLESNLLEGASVRDAYAVLGYQAVAVGNHEFDFGPAGPRPTPQPGDDPRGALKALAKGSPFPFLVANVEEEATGRPVAWDNVRASAAVTVAGVKIGIVGITTEELLHTTIASNVKGLRVTPAAAAIEREAAALRKGGARAIVVVAHAGSMCKAFTNDVAADQCNTDEEIFHIARALPKGTVDVVVGGHTHSPVAHDIEGIAVIEQYAYGRAFGRVDLTFDGDQLVGHHIFAPRELCPGEAKPAFATCAPGDYEGAPVVRAPAVEAAIAAGVEAAKERRAAPVGVVLADTVHRAYQTESALGNLFADLILAASPGADVALMNGGGLREDLPRGDLLYGTLFESFPFDNLLATARITAGDLERLLAGHLAQSNGGILSIAGLDARARCHGSAIGVELRRKGDKKPLADGTQLLLAASDFMLLGGDGFWGEVAVPEVTIGADLMRDAMERELAAKKKLSSADVFDDKKRRLDLAKPRPIKCP
jgi:2',3'-cyclic-nucleotide 2'-phosphodiesterase (5'-nucleotidase family)